MHPAALIPLLFWPASRQPVHLDVECHELAPVERAALEVRARAELEAAGGEHDLQISCSERAATLRLKPYHQIERWIRIEVPGRAPGVDEILHALASLLVTPTAQGAKRPAPLPEPAPPPATPTPSVSRPAAGTTWPDAPTPKAPRTVSTSVALPAPTPEEQPSIAESTPEPWRATGGLEGQVWSGGTIALGPVVGLLAPFASLQIGYASTVAGSPLTVHALDGTLAFEYSPAFATFITASFGVCLTYLSVNPSNAFSPNEKNAWFGGANAAVFAAAPLSRQVVIRAGPKFSYFGSSTVIELDSQEALRVGPWVAGAATEVAITL